MVRSKRPLSPGHIQNLVLKEHDTVEGGTTDFWGQGGFYQQDPTAGTSGNWQRLWLNKEGMVIPERQNLLLDDVTTGTGSGTGTTTIGLGVYKECDLFLDVTAAAGGTDTADRTLAIFIDTRLDGTNYTNIAQFNGTGSVVQYHIHLTKQFQTTADLNVTADAGAGTIRAVGWADDLRVRRDITGTSPDFDYRVWINLST